MRNLTMMRTAALFGVAALLATACGGAAQQSPSQPQTLTKVTLKVDTNFLPKHGIFFAAQGLGFYKEEGLDVEIQPSTGSLDTSIAVGAGKVDFGFADFDTMVKARTLGAMDVQLAVIHAQSPFAVVTLPETGIKTFQDLKGKQIAGEPAGSTTILFPVALQLCHMTMKDVNFISVDTRTKLPGLQAGRWQAFTAYSVSDPATMIGENLKPVVIPWTQCGFSGYSNGLIASDTTLNQKPDLVKRFVRATLRGVKWACDNPDAAAQNTTKTVSLINLKAAKAGIQLACGIVWTPEAEKNGLGYMDRGQVTHTVDLAKQYLGLTGNVNVGDMYTNNFNPKILKSTAIKAPGK